MKKEIEVRYGYVPNKKPPEKAKPDKDWTAVLKREKSVEWVRWVLAETGGVSSIDMSLFVGGEQALRRASQSHQGHMDVREHNPRVAKALKILSQAKKLEDIPSKDPLDALEGFMEVGEVSEPHDDLEDWEIQLFEDYMYYVLEEILFEPEFLELRGDKALAWSYFMEEVDWNFRHVDNYEREMDRKFILLRNKGRKPTDKSWDLVLNYLDKLKKEACRWYWNKKQGKWKPDLRGYQGKTIASSRGAQIQPFYDAAMAATDSYNEFWETDDGEILSDIKQVYKPEAWQALERAGLADKWYLYHRLVNYTFTRNSIDTEPDPEIDDFTLRDEDRGKEWSDYSLKEEIFKHVFGLPDEELYNYMETYPHRPREFLETLQDDDWVVAYQYFGSGATLRDVDDMVQEIESMSPQY